MRKTNRKENGLSTRESFPNCFPIHITSFMDEQLQQNPQGFRVAQAAARINVSRRFLERQIALHRLPVVRLGPRCVRVRAEDLAAYLQRFLVFGSAKNSKSVMKEFVP